MPCKCEGYPPPTLADQLAEREKRYRREYAELYVCHQTVVEERDALLLENSKLKQAIVDKVLG